MSLHAVERLLFEMNRDPSKVSRFRADAEELLRGRDLTPRERELIASGDVLGLYRHGVHPLLLAPASRFFGLGPEEFRAALAPAIGERQK